MAVETGQAGTIRKGGLLTRLDRDRYRVCWEDGEIMENIGTREGGNEPGVSHQERPNSPRQDPWKKAASKVFALGQVLVVLGVLMLALGGFLSYATIHADSDYSNTSTLLGVLGPLILVSGFWSVVFGKLFTAVGDAGRS